MTSTAQLPDPDALTILRRVDSTAPTGGRADQAVIFCDADTAFSAGPFEPNASVLAAFGNDDLHACRLSGEWDMERAVHEHSDILVRSVHDHPKESEPQWFTLTFRFGPRSILYACMDWVIGFAGTHAEAQQLVTRFNDAYAKPPKPVGGSFHLIMQEETQIESKSVPLAAKSLLSESEFRIHYPTETVEWHRGFTRQLCERPHGLSILEGSPGTGKTSYLRHLMGTLKKSHRFYFIPSAALDVLTSLRFIGFWAAERLMHEDRQFVVILEDSDTALMTRESDNREHVSAILNLSDGMLADFLRLQIICTINCKAADVDPALLRPGRLLSHHVFGRLDHTHATRLAKHLGKTLPQGTDFSLAEVFAGCRSPKPRRSSVGFTT